MSKSNLFITSISCLTALISTIYAIQQRKQTKEKILVARADAIKKLQPVSEQNTFPHPSKSDLDKTNKNTLKGIAYQIDINTYSSNDFGNLTREYVIMIFNELSENMRDEETLSEYFNRKT